MGSHNRLHPRFFPTRGYTPARTQPASNTNRLNHGFRSSTVLLPGDDPAEYEALLTDLSEHFGPTDLTDTRFVREMADAEWRLRRVRSHMESALSRHILTLAPQNPALDELDLQSLAVETLHLTGCSCATWLRYETKFERQYDRAYNAWGRYQATKLRHSTAEIDRDIERSCAIPPAEPEPAPVPLASNVQNPGSPPDNAQHTSSASHYSPSAHTGTDTLLQDAH